MQKNSRREENYIKKIVGRAIFLAHSFRNIKASLNSIAEVMGLSKDEIKAL